jgi:hypothetical protein
MRNGKYIYLEETENIESGHAMVSNHSVTLTQIQIRFLREIRVSDGSVTLTQVRIQTINKILVSNDSVTLNVESLSCKTHCILYP